VERLEVFGTEGDDAIYGFTMLPDGDIVVAGECCADATFIPNGDACGATQSFVCVAQLDSDSFVTQQARKLGMPGSRAVDVALREKVDGTPEIMVAGEVRIGANLSDPLTGCDVGPFPEPMTPSSQAVAVMSLEPDTLDCEAGVYRWAGELQGIGVDSDSSRLFVTGSGRELDFLGQFGLDEAGFVFSVPQDTPEPGSWQTWDGEGRDEGYAVIGNEGGQAIVLGGITVGGTFSTGNELTPPPPADRAALVMGIDEGADVQWFTLLSTNVGSDAKATGAVPYGPIAIVVGTFTNTDRNFQTQAPLDAVGEQDMFVAHIDRADGKVHMAAGFGAPGATVEATEVVVLESHPVIAGHTDSTLDTPSGSIECPSGASGCAFLVRIEDL
jgi:hypothetical protein